MTVDSGTPSRREAQRTFCEREYGGLVRYCIRLTGDEQSARDIAQEAFVRLFGRWVEVREPRAYLYLIATNLVRRQHRRRCWELAALVRAHPRAEHVAGPDIGVRDVVARLPRRWREVVVLHYYADLPVGQIARELRQPEGTVRRLLTEARALLATALGDPRDPERRVPAPTRRD